MQTVIYHNQILFINVSYFYKIFAFIFLFSHSLQPLTIFDVFLIECNSETNKQTISEKKAFRIHLLS